MSLANGGTSTTVYSQMGELESYTDVLKVTNQQIADMWLHYGVGAVHLFKDEVRIHFYWLNKEDAPVVYLPFINERNQRVVVTGASGGNGV